MSNANKCGDILSPKVMTWEKKGFQLPGLKGPLIPIHPHILLKQFLKKALCLGTLLMVIYVPHMYDINHPVFSYVKL